jgi:hypothetical protein
MLITEIVTIETRRIDDAPRVNRPPNKKKKKKKPSEWQSGGGSNWQSGPTDARWQSAL